MFQETYKVKLIYLQRCCWQAFGNCVVRISFGRATVLTAVFLKVPHSL